MQDYGNVEILSEDNQLKCTKCNKKTNCKKSIQINRVGPILIFTFQRFKDGKKNTDLINFPITDLDMSKYLVGPQKDENNIYDLYGVVNHSGCLGGGHYTAQCFNRQEGKWFNFNDSFVKPFSTFETLESEILTPRAYVLFYQKRGFDLNTPEDFESIKRIPSGSHHKLLKFRDPN